MLDRLAACAHRLRVLIETALHLFKHFFMFPTGDPTLDARRALIFDRAFLAGIGPVSLERQTTFLIGEVELQPLTSRTDVDVVVRDITEVCFDKTASLLVVRGLWLW